MMRRCVEREVAKGLLKSYSDTFVFNYGNLYWCFCVSLFLWVVDVDVVVMNDARRWKVI